MSRSDYKNLYEGYLDNTKSNLIRRENYNNTFREKYDNPKPYDELLGKLFAPGDELPNGVELRLEIKQLIYYDDKTKKWEYYFVPVDFDIVGVADDRTGLYKIRIKNGKKTSTLYKEKQRETSPGIMQPMSINPTDETEIDLSDLTKTYNVSYKNIYVREILSGPPTYVIVYYFLFNGVDYIPINPYSKRFINILNETKPNESLDKCNHLIMLKNRGNKGVLGIDDENIIRFNKDYEYIRLPITSRNVDCVSSGYGDYIYNSKTNLYESNPIISQQKVCGGKDCEIKTRPIQDSDCCLFDNKEVYENSMMVKKNRLNRLSQCIGFTCDSSKNTSRTAEPDCCDIPSTYVYENGRMVLKKSKKTNAPGYCKDFTCVNTIRDFNIPSECDYQDIKDTVTNKSCTNINTDKKGGTYDRSKITQEVIQRPRNPAYTICKEKTISRDIYSKSSCPSK